MPLFSTVAAGLVTLGIGSATAAALAPTVVSLAASAGLTLLSNALAPADAVQKPGAAGMDGTTSSDPTFPRTWGFGTYRTGGSQVWSQVSDVRPAGGTHGGDAQNRYLDQVNIVADHRIEDIVRLWCHDRPIPVSGMDGGGDPGIELDPYTRNSIPHSWAKLFKGGQSAADDRMVECSNLDHNGDPIWTEDHILTETAVARHTTKANTRLFPQAPAWSYLVKGAAIYDVSKDTSAGGSGTHVLGTRSTHEYSENPAAGLYHFMRGFKVGGRHFVGLQGSQDKYFDIPSFIQAIDDCNDNVGLRDTADTEKRYKCGYEFSTELMNSAVCQTFLSAMAGRLCFTGTRYRLFAGKAQPIAFSFTDDDVIVSEPRERAPKLGMAELVNKVTGECIRADKDWLPSALPPRSSSEDIAADGGRINLMDLQLHMVSSETQGQRIMEIARRQARYQDRQRVVLPMNFLGAETGDWCEWTSAKWGYAPKTFWVESMELSRDLLVVLNLAETADAVFDWTPNTDQILTKILDLDPGQEPDDDTGLAILTATAYQEANANGFLVPGIKLTWNDLDNDRVDRVLVQWRLDVSGSKIFSEMVPVQDMAWNTSKDILPEADYQYRLVPVTQRGELLTPTHDWASAPVITTLELVTDRPAGDNLLFNPGFERTSGTYAGGGTAAEGWVVESGTAWGVVTSVGNGFNGSDNYLRFDGTGDASVIVHRGQDCEFDQSWYAAIRLRRSGTTTATAYRVAMSWRDKTGTEISETFGAVASLTTTFTILEVSGRAPSGAVKVKVRLYVVGMSAGAVWFDNAVLLKNVEGKNAYTTDAHTLDTYFKQVSDVIDGEEQKGRIKGTMLTQREISQLRIGIQEITATAHWQRSATNSEAGNVIMPAKGFKKPAHLTTISAFFSCNMNHAGGPAGQVQNNVITFIIEYRPSATWLVFAKTRITAKVDGGDTGVPLNFLVNDIGQTNVTFRVRIEDTTGWKVNFNDLSLALIARGEV